MRGERPAGEIRKLTLAILLQT